MAKSRKSEVKEERPWQECNCFSVYAYDLHEDVEDDNSPIVGRAYEACGEQTQSTYRQGHDAKLKSVLLSCYRDGIEYGRLGGSLLSTVDPMLVARELGWEHFMTAGKPKAERKAKAPKATTEVSADQRLAQLQGMKDAAKLVKQHGLTDTDGKRIQVTKDNYQSIIDGTYDIEPPAAETSSVQVGSEVKVMFRGTTRPGTVTEIKGSRAKVQFVQVNGKTVERPFELASLR